ncbi:tripartite tricarboxylate transporter substrate binding protein [Bordetella sp. BOR01]|uniref:Bug family tripartite tricarboxylate transporter substrate binding protein n=1 Tax=Bordetella sp. BOR01 TaxID=2854779 RepID=UPI001C496A88|nr:tripartite tricarboxylate transporter substrate-binding protein [Bordetella sp. BOR01]MBV7484910.1 tripartite tricarboxylate transporter substrate binding protein [Bordetella sp. BOR01]
MKTLLACLLALSTISAPALAQNYPDRPVRVLVPFAPGGVVDIAARHVSEQLSKTWNQSVIVENRPGGNGFIATTAAARAAPDGYTLLMAHTGEFSVNPAVFPKVPYDLDRDFEPITLVSDTPLVLATKSDSKLDSIKTVIELSKATPDSLTFSSPGRGSFNHLAGEWFANSAGIELMHVPYRGGSPAAAAVASGEVSLGVVAASSMDQFVKSGHVKILAVMTKRKIASRPDWPTLEDAGVKDVDAANWVGLFAPKGTPPEILEKINRDVNEALQSRKLQETFAMGGGEAVGTTPQEFRVRIARDLQTNREIAQRANVQMQE